MKIYWLNPPLSIRTIYADLGWMNFSTACSQYEWIWPIIDWAEYHNVDDVVEHVLENNPDVICTSSYTWNHVLIDLVCSKVKEVNPNVIIIQGGPQQSSLTLKECPFVDYLCYTTGYGEEFLKAALPQLEQHGKIIEPDKVPWIVTREYSAPTPKVKYEYPSVSSLEHNLPYLFEVVSKAKARNVRSGIQYETTRGCPYECTYCEWGAGGTGAKVSQQSMDIISKDIDIIGLVGIKDLEIIDANFGILNRDADVVMEIVNTRERYGFPQTMMLYGLAKVKVEKKERVLDLMFKHGLAEHYFMSLQTVSDEALDNVKRTNITIEENIALAKKYRDLYGASIKAELILGLPGSTIDDFYAEMDIIQETNGWDWPRAPFLILPATEAATPFYQRLHKLKVVTAGVTENEEQDVTYISSSVIGKYRSTQQMVVGSYSFTPTEWKEMFVMNKAQKVLGPLLTSEQQASVELRKYFKIIEQQEWYKEIDVELDKIINNERQTLDFMLFNNKTIEDYVNEHIEEIKCMAN